MKDMTTPHTTPREHLLVPVDDSPATRFAVECVGREHAGAAVTLLHVAPVPPELLEHQGASAPEREAALEARLAERDLEYERELEEEGFDALFVPLERCLDTFGVTVERKVVAEAHPDAAYAVVEEVRGGGYDGVVVGRNPQSKMGHWLFSSVAEKIREELGDDRVTIVDDVTASSELGEASRPVRGTAPEATRSVDDGTADATTSPMERTVSTVYPNPEDANAAMEALLEAGFDRSAISLLMSKRTRRKHYPDDSSHGPIGVTAGVGGIVGSLIGLAIAPVSGLFAAGPLLALLGGAALGAAGGGLFGALVEIGVPEHHARRYEEILDEGGVFVAVDTTSAEQMQQAEEILIAQGSDKARTALHVVTHEAV